MSLDLSFRVSILLDSSKYKERLFRLLELLSKLILVTRTKMASSSFPLLSCCFSLEYKMDGVFRRTTVRGGNFSGEHTVIRGNVLANGCYQFAIWSPHCFSEWTLSTRSYLLKCINNRLRSFCISLRPCLSKWCYQIAVLRSNILPNG